MGNQNGINSQKHVDQCFPASEQIKMNGLQMMDEQEKIQYEMITNTIQYKQKYKIQDQAITQFNTNFSQLDINCMQQSSTSSTSSLTNSIMKDDLIKFRNFSNYQESIQFLQQLSDQNMISQYELIPFSYQIGKGGQGSVELNFANIKQPIYGSQNLSNHLLPIATKKFQDRDQFIRESVILQKLQGKLKPAIVYIDRQTCQINMEMCICTLEDFKNYIYKNKLQSDHLFSQMIINLMSKVQILLNQGLFHGDIKPTNIAVALRNKSADFIFIDFGSSSWDKSDYYNYYTPAFSNPVSFSYINAGQVLNNNQIRFSEFYSICRTIQILMLSSKQSNLFKKQCILQFMSEYKKIYPISIEIMAPFLLNLTDEISDSYLNDILSKDTQLIQIPVQINEQNLFEKVSVLQNI